MSELRQDPLTGGWVIVSPRRNKRPFDFVSETKEEEATECSFCEGHENETPPEILSLRSAHEVIIETPEHKEDLFSLEDEHIRKVIEVYRDRIVKLMKIPYIKYVLVFKNQGREAGASLRHSHSQVIATPIIPRNIHEELEGAKRYYELNKRCIFCDIMAQELALRKRVILENEMGNHTPLNQISWL